jgi:hypothetical protein
MTTTIQNRPTTCVACHERSPSTGLVCETCHHEAAKPPRGLSITFIEPTGRGGGIIEIAHVRARLSPCQLGLVEALARRMLAEKDHPAPVRGFVRSSELLGTLSWDTSTPVDSHIKQLVRRVRRRLMELGFGDLIEARHGFGYRLRWEPGAGSLRTSSAS